MRLPALHAPALVALAMTLSCSEIPTAPRLGSVTVSGRITDRDGPPLAGIYVRLELEPPVEGLPSNYGTQTNVDGRYELKVPEGLYRVRLDPGYEVTGGYPFVDIGRVKIGSSGAVINYRYTGVRVTGTITGPNGASLSDATVGTAGVSGGENVYAYARSAQGTYSLLIPAGVYDFQAAPGGYLQEGLPVIRSRGVPVLSDTTIDFALTGFAVTGTFSLSGGTPMIGAYLAATNDDVFAAARTGLDGTATLYLPAGNYEIRGAAPSSSIAGPITIMKSIVADDALTFDFSGVRWDMTIRRASDNSFVTGAGAVVREAAEPRAAYGTTDLFGRVQFLVRPGRAYDLTVSWIEGGYYRDASVSNLFSAADTTFDISINVPALP